MKNVLKNAMKATVVATVVAGAAIMSNAQEAAAFNITAGSKLKLVGTEAFTINPDFSNSANEVVDFTVGALPVSSVLISSASTISFASLAGTDADISNITVADFLAGRKNAFIRLFNTIVSGPNRNSDDVFFNLTGVTGALGDIEDGAVSFLGEFVTSGGLSLAQGVATVNSSDSAPWRMTITATDSTPVPTPALLPGFAAMGLGMLRKKRQAKTAVA